jgi:ferric-dicitrate binding protein FerR (iron transport regulator)
MPGNLIPLPKAPAALEARGAKPVPRYRHLYNLVLDRRIPAQQINGRWHVDDADLPAIARALGASLPADIDNQANT